MIALIDYGAGNIRSVSNALSAVGARHRVATLAGDLLEADGLLLPGVGHFGPMMRSLRATGLDKAILAVAESGTPLLGICLGMQALFEFSDEAPGEKGLGLLPGMVMRLPSGVKAPQMGWNEVEIEGRASGYYYFANSFYAPLCEWTVSTAEYGVGMSAQIRKANVEGVQFHPEKSGRRGLELLRDWSARC